MGTIGCYPAQSYAILGQGAGHAGHADRARVTQVNDLTDNSGNIYL